MAVPERPYVALLPFGLEQDITTLSAVKSVEDRPSPEEESRQVAETLNEVLTDARWLLLSRLATSQQFRFVSLEQTDAVALELGLKRGALPTPDQLGQLRRRLNADLIVAAQILEYGQIRWQWFVTGAVAELSLETVVIGLATAWNPVIILANVGVDVLVNAALLLGEAICLASPFVPLSSKQEPWRRCKEIPSGKRLMGPFMPGVHSSNYLNRNEGRKNLSSASTWERP